MSGSTTFGSGTFGSGPLGTAPFFNVQSLIDAVLYGTGHSNPSQETTKRAAILQFLNNSYQEICMGKHYQWMEDTYDIPVYAPYGVGTVSVTNGSTTVTGSGTVWSSNQVKGKFAIMGGDNNVYYVASVTTPTSLELETPWAGVTDTALAYNIFASQLQLPSTVGDIRAMGLDTLSLKMMPLGNQEFRQLQQKDPTRNGPPTHYTLLRRDVDDDRVYAEIFPAPDQTYNIHLDYTVRILGLEDRDDCYPIIPDRYRVVLYYGALAQFYRYLNDEQGEQNAKMDFQRTFLRLQGDTQTTDSHMVFKPERNYRNRTRRRGWLSGRGFFDRYNFGRWD